MGAGHCSGAGEQQCSSRRACGGCGRGGPGHTYLLSFCSTGRAGQMAGHPHRAFQRIPPHRFSSHLDGCLSSQLGHRTLKNERGRLSSHWSQCGNPPALVDSCRWAKLIACCAGLFLVWEATLDTHTPLLSQLLPVGRRAFPGVLSSFFPGTCFLSSPCPGRRDALVLGPRFKLSSSHWPGPASSGRSTSLDKDPKP